jgi:ATP-dependent Clp protease protease subunit
LIYVEHTGKSLDEIEKALDRDSYLSSEEAKAFGLIDEVVDNRPVPEGDDDTKKSK